MSQTDKDKIYEDAFNLFCGDKIGSGCFRDVYECRVNPDLVVKVEIPETWRTFSNILEMKFWDFNQEDKRVAQWLAPCEWMSPDGIILLQRKVRILQKGDPGIPSRIPAFLTDRKYSNFGWFEGRLVCCDYASQIVGVPTGLTRAKWWS